MQKEETVKTTTTVKPDTQTETETKETTTVQKPSTTTKESSEDDARKEQTKEAIAENKDRIGNPTKSE